MGTLTPPITNSLVSPEVPFTHTLNTIATPNPGSLNPIALPIPAIYDQYSYENCTVYSEKGEKKFLLNESQVPISKKIKRTKTLRKKEVHEMNCTMKIQLQD